MRCTAPSTRELGAGARACARKAALSAEDTSGPRSRSRRTTSPSLTPPLSALSASVRACAARGERRCHRPVPPERACRTQGQGADAAAPPALLSPLLVPGRACLSRRRPLLVA